MPRYETSFPHPREESRRNHKTQFALKYKQTPQISVQELSQRESRYLLSNLKQQSGVALLVFWSIWHVEMCCANQLY